MKKLLLLGLLAWSAYAFSQSDPSERLKRYEDFHQKLRERILKGFDDSSLEEMNRLVDEMMDEGLRDFPATGLSRFSGGPSMSWSEGKAGRELLIIPKSKNDKLDVQVEEGMITIKISRSEGQMQSHSTHAQNVPGDCDADLVKMDSKNGGLLLFFPWKKTAPSRTPDPGLKPLKPKKDDIEV